MREAHAEAMGLSESELRLLRTMQRWRRDLPGFAKDCLHVVDKLGRLVPLEMNPPQEIIHARLEAQKAEHGMVRAMILKSRKQGSSTYIGARFYARTRLFKHQRAKVVAHDQDSSDVLFGMVRTFYDNDPFRLKHEVGNTKQYLFSNGSSYTVGTAGGSGEAGRGDTPMLAHMSEAAFYKNPEKTIAGFASSVPMAAGTEIVMESTANGVGNNFHKRWIQAEAGQADETGGGVTYLPIFIPWFVSPEYRLRVPDRFVLGTEPEGEGLPSEREIAEMYALDMEQMAWRRFFVEEHFGGAVETFMQEFPCTAAEAFQRVGAKPYIPPILVARARRRKGIEAFGPRILGVDPAGTGGDKFDMTLRQGHVVLWHRGRTGMEPGEEQVEWVADTIRTERVDRVNIDYSGGWGQALLAGLREKHPDIADRCYPVDFGSKSQAKMAQPHRPGPRNRRAEMYERMLRWFELPEGVSIPDDDELPGDLSAVTAKISGMSTDLLLTPKNEIRAVLGRSPDRADSTALTFAFPDRVIHPLHRRQEISVDAGFGAGQPVPEDNFTAIDTRTAFDSGGGWMT